MKRHILYIIFNLLLLQSCNFFAAGSYPFAEYYAFSFSKEELIEKVEDFKNKNPEYRLIEIFSDGEEKEIPDEYGENFYYLFFYFKDTNKTIHCIINEGDNGGSTIGLDAIANGVNKAGWKRLNTKDLNKDENAEIKKRFEIEILDSLGKWKRMDTRF